MRPGGTEFDFDVHSRATRDGRAEDIAATRTGLHDEFVQRRVKTNLYGLPINPGNAWAVASGAAPAELSYGELQPQVFRSRHVTDPVGWTINFRRAYYAGQASKRVTRPAQSKRGGLASQSGVMAQGSAAVRAQGGSHANGQANGDVGPIGTDAILRLYVRNAELTRYRPSSRAFGSGDMIFDSPSVFQRLGNLLGIGR